MYHFWGMGWVSLFGVAILVALIWLVIRLTNQSGNTGRQGKSALDILKERYARGEIGKEEFEEKRKGIQD
jgi:putative membrane protein